MPEAERVNNVYTDNVLLCFWKKGRNFSVFFYDIAERTQWLIMKVSQAGKAILCFWNEETAKPPLTEVNNKQWRTK